MTVATFQEPSTLAGDFFGTRARVPFSEMFLMAGVPARILTNSEAIMTCAGKLFLRLNSPRMDPGFTLRLWMSQQETDSIGDVKPCYRGLGRFLFAGFGGPNFLVVDLVKRLVAGRFSADFVADEKVWRKTVFTVIAAMMAPAAGAAVLHCAAVEHEQRGLILVGPSGSGKSTLSLALGQRGLGLLSDDRICFSLQNQRLLGWSMGGYWKLRAEANHFFPELRAALPVRVSPEGMSTEFDPEETLGFRRSKCCEPDWVVLLEKEEKESCELTPMSAAEAALRLEEGLYEEAPEVVERQRAIIGELVKRPCHLLRYGVSPSVTAQLLCGQLGSLRRANYAVGGLKPPAASGPRKRREDPLRRFTPLSYKTGVRAMGRHGELVTNSSRIVECARKLFPGPEAASPGGPEFTWRIVAEEVDGAEEPWPVPAGFSANGLRLLRVHEKSFIAVDTESAEGVGVVSTSKLEDLVGIASVFMPGLFYATAPALGLTPLASSCVSTGEHGLLMLGLPGAGKTSCAYAARKLGLDFQSGMVTFLEVSSGRLFAHGELWSTLFRRETAQFYPELLYLGRALKHVSQTFLAVDKSLIGSTSARGVTPTVAVCLERSTADPPRLSQLSPPEFARILAACAPFEEEEVRFRAQRNLIRTQLEKIPAYRLVYRGDPAEAAVFCKSLLRIHGGMGAPR